MAVNVLILTDYETF